MHRIPGSHGHLAVEDRLEQRRVSTAVPVLHRQRAQRVEAQAKRRCGDGGDREQEAPVDDAGPYCCRALKLATTRSLSMRMRYDVVRRHDDAVVAAMTAAPPSGQHRRRRPGASADTLSVLLSVRRQPQHPDRPDTIGLLRVFGVAGVKVDGECVESVALGSLSLTRHE